MTLPRTLFLAVSTSLCLQMGGCAAHEAARAIAEDAGPTGPEPSTAPPGPPAETSAIRVSAAYPATLFYALDAAAGVRNRDPGYRAWIYDGDEVPAWLEAYSARRRTWTARIDDSGGGSLAIERCARDAIHLDAAIACIEKVIPAADRGVLRTAVEKADSRVAPHHRRAAPHLETMLGAMRDGLASRDATELLRLLRDESGLEDSVRIAFQVVLVAKPDGDHAYAMQDGEALVHEVGRSESSGGLLAVAFHEIAHLAHRLSPRRKALEEAFVSLGDDGLLAANLWDEAVATAFGNGLAGERFNPDFRADLSLYAEPRVAKLGLALYREWRAGKRFVLDGELASWLTVTAATQNPAPTRTMGDLMWYVVAYAETAAPLQRLLKDVSYRSASRRTPLDDELALDEGDAISATRIALATQGELIEHPALVARFGLSTVDDALQGRASRVVRRPGVGPLELLVIAKGPSELETIAEALSRQRVPERT